MSITNNELSAVTTLLEDISIKLDGSNNDECIIKSKNPSKLLSLDTKTVELVELLCQYEELANDDFRLNFINGYLNLSRANYSSGSVGKKYGIESYDLREYIACKEVSYKDERFDIKDNLGNYITKKKEIEDKKREKEDKMKEKETKNNKKDSKEHPEQEEKTGLTSATESSQAGTIRNRKIKPTNEPEEQEDSNKIPRDPLKQFGTLVPYQLRQAQSYFTKALNNSVEIINIQRKITKLVSEIDQIKDEYNEL